MTGWRALDHKLTEYLFRFGERSKSFWIFWSRWIGVCGVVGWTFGFAWNHDYRLTLPYAVLVTALVFLLTIMLQEAIRRHRPMQELHSTYHPLGTPWSFPSVHASTVSAWATSIFYGASQITLGFSPQEMILISVGILVAACVAFSRVFLGVHHLFDVLAGALLGAGVSIILLSL